MLVVLIHELVLEDPEYPLGVDLLPLLRVFLSLRCAYKELEIILQFVHDKRDHFVEIIYYMKNEGWFISPHENPSKIQNYQ